MYGIIYLTTNKVNNKKYVGMCKSTHIDNYLGSGKLLKQAIKKYGKENFERKTLQECKTFDELSKAEEYWINYYDAHNNEEFYNLNKGGFGGCSYSMSKYWSNMTKEERKNSRNWAKPKHENGMKGRKHTEETKRKIGAASKNRNWSSWKDQGRPNPKTKPIRVLFEDKEESWNSLKEFSEHYNYNYSSMKSLLQNGNFSQKYKLRIVDARL